MPNGCVSRGSEVWTQHGAAFVAVFLPMEGAFMCRYLSICIDGQLTVFGRIFYQAECIWIDRQCQYDRQIDPRAAARAYSKAVLSCIEVQHVQNYK